MQAFETFLRRQFTGPNSTLGLWEIADGEPPTWVLEPKLYDAQREGPFAADPGRYQVVWTKSARFGHSTLELVIPRRTGMRVHTGLNWTQTLGCLLPGHDYTAIGGEYQIKDVASSVRARDRCNELFLAQIRKGGLAFVTITNPEAQGAAGAA